MTVITKEADGEQKVYPFRLNAVTDIADQTVTLNVIFKGGARPAAGDAATNRVAALTAGEGPLPPRKPHAPTTRRRGKADDEAAAERIRTDAFNGVGGCHYTAQGPAGSPVEPLCPLSNGIWTIMRFAGLTQKPAVYISSPTQLCGADNGAHERLARQHGAGDFIVVEEIAQRFCVRLGSSVLQIDNTAFNPTGSPTGTGTIARTVRRDLIKATAK